MKEQMSAWLDGEVDARTAKDCLQGIKKDQDLAAEWETYHLISDALRGVEPLDTGFCDRFKARLDQEPTLLAPQARRPSAEQLDTGKTGEPRRIWAVAASLAGLAMAALVLIPLSGSRDADVQLAAANTSPKTLRTTVRVDRMQAYLAAHQESSSALPAEMRSGVTTVSFQSAADTQ